MNSSAESLAYYLFSKPLNETPQVETSPDVINSR